MTGDGDYRVIALGVSANGLTTLETLFAGLPRALRAPVLVVRHRSPAARPSLAALLQPHTDLRVTEAVDGARLDMGVVYLAPAGRHLIVRGGRTRRPRASRRCRTPR